MSEKSVNPIALLDVLFAQLPDWKALPGIPPEVIDAWLEHPMTKMVMQNWLAEIQKLRIALRSHQTDEVRNWFLSRMSMAEDAVNFPYVVRAFHDPDIQPKENRERIEELLLNPSAQSMMSRHTADTTLKMLNKQAEVLRQQEGQNNAKRDE